MNNIFELYDLIGALINSATVLVIGLTVVIFLVGLTRYILSGKDENKRKEAKGMIIFGIIALFVMVSFWGLVAFLRTTIFFESGAVN